MTPEDMTPEERAQDCFEAVAAALGHWPPLEAKEHILTTVRDAILSERERCLVAVAGLADGRENPPDHGDEKGEAYLLGWNQALARTVAAIREGT